MRNLVIGDIHFGIKTNSISWMESQIKFIKEQVITAAKDNNVDNVIFLGDLFDIRYAVNQVIGINVQRIIRILATELSDKKIIFIAGNHDYYSPLKDMDEYNIYDLVFTPEFLQCYENIRIINKEPYCIDDELFVPWYWTENPEALNNLVSYIKEKFPNKKFKTIYCHSDLCEWPDYIMPKLGKPTVYAGHIHDIVHYMIDDEKLLYNIGAALPLTFNDSNSSRYIYIIEDCKITKQIENITTPRFKRFYNEDIFTISQEDVDNSYIQLCILDSNINKSSYIEQIKYIKNTYVDSNIKINVITNENYIDGINNESINVNIDTYIENNIPEHLKAKYNDIKQKVLDNKK